MNTEPSQSITIPLRTMHSRLYLVFLLSFSMWLLCPPGVNSTVNYRAKEKQILDQILGPGRYDSRIRPIGINNASEIDGPAIVRVNILVRSISKIDDVQMSTLLRYGPVVARVNILIRSIGNLNEQNMEFAVQITFREQWRDDRLQYDDLQGKIKLIVLTDQERIWKPDLFFSNEKDGKFHNIIMPNVLLRIYPDGEVLYSIRISLRLACPMNLKLFPLDKQTCSLTMPSYGYTTEDLVFLWKDGDPVQVTKNLHLPRFTLEKFYTSYCTSKTNTGEYSCLKVDLLFKREFSYYLIQIYIPCCMLVIVSWVSFWLDQNATPARVSLGVTTLLTMATQTSGINASLPPVSYTKAIDVWTGVCLTFVFGALLEFALVNYASRSDQQRAKQKQQRKQLELDNAAALAEAAEHSEDGVTTFGMKPLVRHGVDSSGKSRHRELHVQIRRQLCCKTWLAKFPTRSKRIDVISRITFPIAFALFNVVYWSTYLFRDDEQIN